MEFADNSLGLFLVSLNRYHFAASTIRHPDDRAAVTIETA